jgi:hypothetical protein
MPSIDPIDLDLARALKRLADHGGQSRPTDAKLTVSCARRLVLCGWAESIDPPKLILTAAGLSALPAAMALIAAAPGAGRGARPRPPRGWPCGSGSLQPRLTGSCCC